MPTPTYNLLEEIVLSSAQASVTLGSGGTIPQTYRDLVVEMVGVTTQIADDSFRMRFNGDTASNYSATSMYGTGTSPGSGRRTSQASMFGFIGTGTSSTSATASAYYNVLSYSNTTTYKTALLRWNITTSNYPGVEQSVGLWQATSAITSISLFAASGNVTAGTFRLWGV